MSLGRVQNSIQRVDLCTTQYLKEECFFVRKLKWIVVVSVLAIVLTVQPALARLSLDADVLTRFQTIDSEAGGTSNTQKTGFNSTRGNLHFYWEIIAGVDAKAEFWVNPAPNAINDRDPGDLVFNEAYITLSELHPEIDLKFGEFEVDFGTIRLDRTENGQALDNPLVGNYLVDPVGVQPGIQIFGDKTQFSWAISLTNGRADVQETGGGSGADQYTSGSEFAYTVRLQGEITPKATVATSVYRADRQEALENAGAVSGAATIEEGASNLFGAQYQAGIYQGLAGAGGGFYSPVVGNFNTGGADVTAWQFDAGYCASGFKTQLEAHYGNMVDDAGGSTIDGAVDQDWEYWGVQGRYNLFPQFYGVVRYSEAEDEAAAASALTDEYEKIQVGLGHSPNENTLAKLEYVSQANESDGLANDAAFNGFIAELAATF